MRLASFAGRCFVAIALFAPLAAAQSTAPAVYESPGVNVGAPTDAQTLGSAGTFSLTHPAIPNGPAKHMSTRNSTRELPSFIAKQPLLQNRMVRGLVGTFGGGDVLPNQKPQLITISPSVNLGHNAGFSIHMTINLDRRQHSVPEPQR